MMEEQRTFLVALRGFQQVDLRTIHHIFDLSKSRPRAYQPISGIGQDITLANAATVLPIDLDDGNAPVVWVGGEPNAERPYHVKRPILASRLLRRLDQVTIDVLHFMPEINIGVKSIQGGPGMPQPAARANGHGSSPYRVLVADDSQVVRTQLQLILDNLGIGADFAEVPMTGRSRWSSTRSSPPLSSLHCKPMASPSGLKTCQTSVGNPSSCCRPVGAFAC